MCARIGSGSQLSPGVADRNSRGIGPNGVNSSWRGGPAFTRPVPGGDFSGYIVPG